MRWGAEFDRNADGSLMLTREGRHHANRIVPAGGDATGAEVQRALHVAVHRDPWIRLVEHALVLDLLRDRAGRSSPAGSPLTSRRICPRRPTRCPTMSDSGPSTRPSAARGLTADRARECAETGVDYLSVGVLTNSSPLLDIALDLRSRS